MADRSSIRECSSMETLSLLSATRERRKSAEEKQFVMVGEECKNNQELKSAIQKFNLPYVYSDTGMQHAPDAEYDTVFVLDDFSCGTYYRLRGEDVRLVGPPVVIQAAQKKEHIPHSSRPLYCTSLREVIVCFTGFKLKAELSRLADLVHHMGGSIRKDFSSKVTHLIANSTGGEKYRAAVSFGTLIMSAEWVNEAWKKRNEVEFNALGDSMMEFRIKPFFKCCLGFLGFSEEEVKHMEEVTVENGGTVAPAGDESCTHLVVEDLLVKELPFDTHPKLQVVRTEWFWASIQMEACADESYYQYHSALENSTSHLLLTTPRMAGSRSGSRKRKLRENLAQLASEVDVDSPFNKRRSNEHILSQSASLLDVTCTPDSSGVFTETPKAPEPPTPAPPALSKRQQIVYELLHTETNYVGILHTVLTVFKEGIEDASQRGGPLLSSTNIRHIFGTIPSIYDLHSKIKEELEGIVNDWQGDQSPVGEVILKHADGLMKAYPPFVNFFEKTKATIEECDKNNTRFHAFLMKCRSRPECGRQTLTELLIRPVQRLPSCVLLLNDILKHTSKSSPDHASVQKAISALNDVLKHINEDKRKTEGQVAMFDIVNDVDNCPPNLLSSHRTFVTKLDVVNISETLCSKGDPLTLFVFSDSIEIVKRRTRANFKSPAVPKTPQKAYKHLELLYLTSVKRVADITENNDCTNVFALIIRNSTDTKEKLYSFQILNEEVNKEEFLKTLCRNIANTICKVDHETLLASLDARYLQIDTSEISNKGLKRFGKRVSRAFSFNKTPRKLKRAISSLSPMFSMNKHAHHSHDDSVTPARKELGLRLATADLSDSILTPLPENKSIVTLKRKYKDKSRKHKSASHHGSKTLGRRSGSLPSIIDYQQSMRLRSDSVTSVISFQEDSEDDGGFLSWRNNDNESPIASAVATPLMNRKYNTLGPAALAKLGL